MSDDNISMPLYAAGYADGRKAGLAAAVKKLEEWRLTEATHAEMNWTAASAADRAVRLVKALLEEKP